MATCLVVGLPFLWVLLSAFKAPEQLNDPGAIVFRPTLENWREVVDGDVLGSAGHSIVVAVVTVGLALLVGTPGAYAISRFGAGGSATRFGILLSQVMPPAVLVVPLFLVAFDLGARDTYQAIIVAHLTFVVPVVTWFLIGFFDAVPRSYEEQAMIDGYGRFGAFGFVLSWNDLFYALILAGGNTETLPVSIAGFNTFRGVELGAMCAAILVSVVPVMVACFFVQRRLVRGLSGGGLKY